MIVSTKPLIGRCAERIATVLSDIQPLECHVFCTVSESMHEEYTPLKSGGEGGNEGDLGLGYSHYGEFQAMIRKWIKREVYNYTHTQLEIRVMTFFCFRNCRLIIVWCKSECIARGLLPC